MPGGGLDPGEDPKEGALRELYEETGLRPISISFAREFDNGAGVTCYCFSALYVGQQEPHSDNDPDQECEKWEWVDVSNGLDGDIWDLLAGPKEPRYNALKQVISKSP